MSRSTGKESCDDVKTGNVDGAVGQIMLVVIINFSWTAPDWPW